MSETKHTPLLAAVAPTGNLAYLSGGPEVLWLQLRLNAFGARPALAVDGFFGRETWREVVRFQRAHGIEADGVVGPETRVALETEQKARGVAFPDR